MQTVHHLKHELLYMAKSCCTYINS